MEQQNQADLDQATTDLGAPPPTQDLGLDGSVPALDTSLLQSANPEIMAAMMAGQPFVQDASIGGPAMPTEDPSYLLPMIMANNAPTIEVPSNKVSADDVALYDRQIRLWGMAAQQKIQNAHILLITIRGLANEVAKNLVLAGVGSITLLDGSPVTEVDLGCQFLLAEGGGESLVGLNRALAASSALRKLNPRVQVHVDPESVAAKGPNYFAAYDVVIATDLDPNTFNIINTATRINGRPFYAAGTHGMYGFIFSDLIEHDFVIKRDASNIATTLKQETRTRSIIDVKIKTEGNKMIESVTKRELYSTWFLASDVAVLPPEYTSSKRRLRSVTPALSCLRALWEFKQLQGGRLPSNREDLKLFTQIATQKHKALSLPSETLKPEFLRSFLQNLGSEMAPVTAILGGQLAQDVINVLGQSQQPIQNTVVFDGTTMEALVYPLHPELALGASLLSVPNASVPTSLGAGAGAGVGTSDVAMYSTGGAMYHSMGTIPGGNTSMGDHIAMQLAPAQPSAPRTHPVQAAQAQEQAPAQATAEASPQPQAENQEYQTESANMPQSTDESNKQQP